MHIFYLFMKGKSLFHVKYVAPAFLEAKIEQTYWIKEINHSNLNFFYYRFSAKRSLKNHTRSVHERNKSFNCDICDYISSEKSNIK